MSDNFSDFDNLVDLFTTISSKLLEKAHIYVGTRDAWDQLTVAEKTAYQFTAFLGDTESGIVDDVPTQNSNNLVKSGGVYSQYETLETALDGKINTTDIANNLTTTTTGKVLDATQGKALNDSISATNSQMQTLNALKANESTIAPVQTTLVASQEYKIGEQFYYQNVLYKATANISSGGTITIGGNCSVADDIVSQISKVTPLSFTWVSTKLNKGSTSIDIIGKFMFINIQCDGIISANGTSETVIRTGVNIKTAVQASLWGGYTGKPVRAIITQAGEIMIAGGYNEAQYSDQIRGQLIAIIAN